VTGILASPRLRLVTPQYYEGDGCRISGRCPAAIAETQDYTVDRQADHTLGTGITRKHDRSVHPQKDFEGYRVYVGLDDRESQHVDHDLVGLSGLQPVVSQEEAE